MTSWFTETGFGYVLGVAAVTLIGLLLVCWGLWGDRSMGRARCPKCWYDMRGTLPKLECPECGHDAKQERGLYRNRRGWRRIVVGVLLVLLFSYPLRIVGGWYREQEAMRKLANRVWIGHVVRVGPTLLVARLPEGRAKFFVRIGRVLLRPSATDADVAECWKLPELTMLHLSGTQVTDAGLVHLKGLSQLTWLYLPDTQVTGAGVAKFKQAMPNVEVHR